MYRGTPSPIFDVPEFPTLRRVKPLPKRRRTTLSSGTGGDTLLSLSPVTASALAAQGASILQQSAAAAALLSQHQQQGQGQEQQVLDALGPNPTAEELFAHADTLSARMALQNYYMPILGGVQSLLAGASNMNSSGDGGVPDIDATGTDSNNNNAGTATAAAAAAAALAAVAGAGRNGQLPLSLSDLDSLELGVHFAAAAAAAAAAGVAMGGLGSLGLGLPNMNMNAINMGMGTLNNMVGGLGSPDIGSIENMGERTGGHGRDRPEDDGRGDGDYVDHLRHPGNAKKRKVPANASPRGGSGLAEARVGSPPSSYLDEEGLDAVEGIEDFQLHRYREREHELPDRDRDRDWDRERDQDYHHYERSRSREDYSPSRSHPYMHHHHSRSNSSSNINASERPFPYPYTTPGTGNHTSSSSYTNTDSYHLSTLLMYPPPPFPGQLAMLAKKRGKLTAVTLAGLQHKELLKTRKRQLAAVMGALSHGDTLALDQALTSASYAYGVGLGGYLGSAAVPPTPPTTGSTAAYPMEGRDPGAGRQEGQGQQPQFREQEQQGPRIRKSKRMSVRLARAMRILMEAPERRVRHPDAVPLPEAEFEFVCHSGTADRLSATKEEVATLRKRFEAEFEKQAAKAAKMALAPSAANDSASAVASSGGEKPAKVAKASGGKGKRERQERDRERAERAHAQIQQQQQKASEKAIPDGKENVDVSSPAAATPPPAPTGKSKNGKKKKRSALANASNPHHLKNYVPSRLPHSDGPHGNSGATAANMIWPLPVRFLSAEIPPRSSKGERGGKKGASMPNNSSHHSSGQQPGSNIPLTYPGEEWICAFCEYDLFYGGDAEYRRAVKNRKKILKRRRRARERAARAASGVGNAAKPPVAPVPPPAPIAPPPSEDGGDEDEGYGDEEVYEEVVRAGESGHAVDGVGGGTGRWKGGGGG